MYYVVYAELSATVSQKRRQRRIIRKLNAHLLIIVRLLTSVMLDVLRPLLYRFCLPPQVTLVALFAGDRGRN